MSGALGNIPPAATSAAAPSAAPAASSTPEIDAETRRLQAMVQREEREREQRDRAEQERIQKMLEQEDNERRRRQADIDAETERLRREFGREGQDFPSGSGGSRPGASASPPLPMRHQNQLQFAPPQRPVSAGPASQGQPQSSWWRGPAVNPGPPHQPPPQQQQPPPGRGRNGSGGLGVQNPAARVSGFFGIGREEDKNKKIKKKRSMHW